MRKRSWSFSYCCAFGRRDNTGYIFIYTVYSGVLSSSYAALLIVLRRKFHLQWLVHPHRWMDWFAACVITVHSQTQSLSHIPSTREKEKMVTGSTVTLKKQLWGLTNTYNQPALTFDLVYLHLSSSAHSCQQAATSARLETKQEVTSRPLLRDITGLSRRKR